MRHPGTILTFFGCLMPIPVLAANVTIVPSESTIGQGGSATFTVTVVPDTYVQRVSVFYEGESAPDQAFTRPFEFTHQFNSAMQDLTVTAVVSYSSGAPDDFASVDIDVIGLTLTGPSSPLRGWPSGFTARSNPTGLPISQFNWSFEAEGVVNTFTDFNVDGDDKSIWSGKMVVDGLLKCSAVVGGVAADVAMLVNIAPRGWPISITCAPDNEDWGDEWAPKLSPEAPLGVNRDRDSNYISSIFVPRNGNNFRPAWTMASITCGPNTGWYYVSSCTLKVRRETCINKYIKTQEFADANVNCIYPGAAEFVQAVYNHELRGTPDTYMSYEGHQGRIELAIREFGHDPKQVVEGLYSRNPLHLEFLVDEAISAAETQVFFFAADEAYMRAYAPNWGLSEDSLGWGSHARWLVGWFGGYWSDCVYGPPAF